MATRGNGRCYECNKTKDLTYVSWYPIQPCAENDWTKKGADLCSAHEAIAVKDYTWQEGKNK